MPRIALIGDHDESITAHRAIPLALEAASAALGVDAAWQWIHTSELDVDRVASLRDFDAVWCVPGSPYAHAGGALGAIGAARTLPLPFLGTCGGFQHALMEYARAEWGMAAPGHAEVDPGAADPVISPLECQLVDVADTINFVAGSRLAAIYGVEETREEYRCRFGLNPAYAARLERGPLRVAARDDRGGVVAVELVDHPFFVAALFQPERAALAGRMPVLVRAFVAAAAQDSASTKRAAGPNG